VASIGHVAVGMAMARAYLPAGTPTAKLAKTMAVFGAISMLPDLDVVSFSLGIPYSHPWGHRGATHSICFALMFGAVVWLLLRGKDLPRARTTLFVTVLMITHGLLDALTDGGLGAELLWPFTTVRIFFEPFNRIPVAPIGTGMLSARGVSVVLTELLLFSPFLLYALLPRTWLARVRKPG
jgi:inner membrane protein